jgi:hypothetical protein
VAYEQPTGIVAFGTALAHTSLAFGPIIFADGALVEPLAALAVDPLAATLVD